MELTLYIVPFYETKRKKKKRTLDALHGHGQYGRTITFPEGTFDTYTDDISQSPANRAARENGEMAPLADREPEYSSQPSNILPGIKSKAVNEAK